MQESSPLLSDSNFLDSTMELAIEEAQLSLPTDVPIGALIAHADTGEIIAKAHNEREVNKSATCHAEVTAIEQACRELRDWRLNEFVIFSTLEPCVMCAGAITQARMNAVVFGAADKTFGAAGSIYNFFADPRLGQNIEVIGGILGEKNESLLKDFFSNLRQA